MQFLGDSLVVPFALTADSTRQRVAVARARREAEEREAERELLILVPQLLEQVFKPRIDRAADQEGTAVRVYLNVSQQPAAKRISELEAKLRRSWHQTITRALEQRGFAAVVISNAIIDVSWR